jgi:hypothetical protein
VTGLVCLVLGLFSKNPELTTDTGVTPQARAKNFKIRGEDIKRLIHPMGGCLATDHITVDGMPVRFMDREEPNNEDDCGWQFYSGLETQEYVENPDNFAFYEVNTIANYDPAIIPYLDRPVGTRLERIPGTDEFKVSDS